MLAGWPRFFLPPSFVLRPPISAPARLEGEDSGAAACNLSRWENKKWENSSLPPSFPPVRVRPYILSSPQHSFLPSSHLLSFSLFSTLNRNEQILISISRFISAHLKSPSMFVVESGCLRPKQRATFVVRSGAKSRRVSFIIAIRRTSKRVRARLPCSLAM